MPSRQQQRRRAARDAALANRNVGDWTTQAEDPGVLCRALGTKTLVKQKADEGDREAQFSMGYWLLSDDPMMMADSSIAAGTPISSQAEVGLAPCTTSFGVRQTEMRSGVITFS